MTEPWNNGEIDAEGDSDFLPAEERIDSDTNDGFVDFVKPSDA